MNNIKIAKQLLHLARVLVSADVDWADDSELYKKFEFNEETIKKMDKQLENAKHIFEKAMQDGAFRKLHDAIRSKAVHYNATSSSRSFSFHAPLSQMLDAMKEQGWGDAKDEMAKLVSRQVYSHPDSSVTVMRAEGDAFVVTV